MSLKPSLKVLFLLFTAVIFILLSASCSQTRLIEIQPPPDNSDNFGQVYIGGEVALPGILTASGGCAECLKACPGFKIIGDR